MTDRGEMTTLVNKFISAANPEVDSHWSNKIIRPLIGQCGQDVARNWSFQKVLASYWSTIWCRIINYLVQESDVSYYHLVQKENLSYFIQEMHFGAK